MRDASDSRDWITVKRSKNKKKVGALHEISSSNRVLNISSSNSKKAVMHHEVAPKVQPSSLPKVLTIPFPSNAMTRTSRNVQVLPRNLRTPLISHSKPLLKI
jgi:hypothetical protein